LYEGYLLYPYRTSALKNRRRWTFGALFPPAFADEPSCFRAECLLQGEPDLRVRARFLQLDEETGALERAATTPSFSFGRVEGRLSLSTEPLGEGLHKVVVELANTSPFSGSDRDQAALYAMCSAHAEVIAEGGTFLSLADPPEFARAAAES